MSMGCRQTDRVTRDSAQTSLWGIFSSMQNTFGIIREAGWRVKFYHRLSAGVPVSGLSKRRSGAAAVEPAPAARDWSRLKI